ncbi:MAG: WG repeat-containing protein [Muribaculaceae bacterium]|nr:WG repeat-containing protein [Muribaculaceae bacterium]
MNRILSLICISVLSVTLYAQSTLPELKQDEKTALWGLIDLTTGKWVVKPNYTVIEPVMEGNNKIVSVKGKKGIITPDGGYLQRPEITELNPVGSEGYITVVKGKKGFISSQGSIILPAEYSDIDTSEADFFIVKKGDKAGLTSRKGEILLEPSKYNEVTRFDNYWKIKKGNKTGLFDASKRTVLVEPNYADILKPVILGTGEVIIPAKKQNDKWGALSTSGKEVIKFRNQRMTSIPAMNAIRVYRNKIGDRLYFIDPGLFLELRSWDEKTMGPFHIISGELEKPSLNTPDHMIVALTFGEHATYSSNYEQRKSVYDNFGFNKTFKVVTDKNGKSVGESNSKIEPFANGSWLVINERRPWVVYDADGNVIVESDIRGSLYNHSASQGWYATKNKVLFPDLKVYNIKDCGPALNFIDKDGKGSWIPMIDGVVDFETEPCDDVKKLGINLAAVCKSGNWGVYAKGEQLISPQFDAITESPREWYIEVIKDGKIGLYNLKTRKWVLPVSYNLQKYEFYNNNADSPIFIYNGKWGLADANGNIIKKMVFDKNTITDSLKPKPTVESKSQKPQKKPTTETKRKKSNTDFQESKEKRRF